MVGFTPVQLIAVLFAIFMIFITALMVKRKKFDFKGSLLWFLLWASLVVAILFFQQVSKFSLTYLGVEPQDLFIFVAIFALFAMFFQYNLKMAEYKKNLNEITYEVARRDAKKHK